MPLCIYTLTLHRDQHLKWFKNTRKADPFQNNTPPLPLCRFQKSEHWKKADHEQAV